ncbi:MAG: hypothetical protein KDE51_10230 [Anaerolineales bacterium]|nr:hypothetical protein [Anaerolineales bacterium]
MKILYRAGQFWRLLTARPLTAVAQKDVQAQLNLEEYLLFQRYSVGDQWHGYRVMCMLREAGHSDGDLLTAALLHDIGKTRVRFTAVERSIVSVISKVRPQMVKRWEQLELHQVKWWQRPFLVNAQQPAWSAEMALAAGSTPRAVLLMKRHQDKLNDIVTEEDQLLFYLQWADDQN